MVGERGQMAAAHRIIGYVMGMLDVNDPTNEAIIGANPPDPIERLISIAGNVSGIQLLEGAVLTMQERMSHDYPSNREGDLRRIVAALGHVRGALNHTESSPGEKVGFVRAFTGAFFRHFGIEVLQLNEGNATNAVSALSKWMIETCKKMKEKMWVLTNQQPLPTSNRALKNIHRSKFEVSEVPRTAEGAAAGAAAAAAAAASGDYDAVVYLPDTGAAGSTDAPAATADDPMNILAQALAVAQSSVPTATTTPAPGFEAFQGKARKLVEEEAAPQEPPKPTVEELEKQKRDKEEDEKLLAELMADCVKFEEELELDEELMRDAVRAALEEQTSSEDDDEEDDDPQAIFPKIRKFPKRPK